MEPVRVSAEHLRSAGATESGVAKFAEWFPCDFVARNRHDAVTKAAAVASEFDWEIDLVRVLSAKSCERFVQRLRGIKGRHDHFRRAVDSAVDDARNALKAPIDKRLRLAAARAETTLRTEIEGHRGPLTTAARERISREIWEREYFGCEQVIADRCALTAVYHTASLALMQCARTQRQLLAGEVATLWAELLWEDHLDEQEAAA